MRTNRIAGLTAVIGLGLAAAAGAQVASLQLSPARGSATAGDTVQFTLIAKDSTGRTITAPNPLWLVGPFEIAAVSQTGLARTFRQGDARVMVRVAGKMAQAELTILAKGPNRVAMSVDAPEILVGGLGVARGVATTEDDEPRYEVPVGYRSSDPKVATVDASGAVRAVAPGTATIRGESGRSRGEVSVRVLPNPVGRLEITGERTARTGDVVRFQVRAFDRTGKALGQQPVRWSVSGSGAIYPDGGFVARAPGAYVVSALAGVIGASTTIAVSKREHDRVFEPVTSVTFSALQAAEGWAVNDVLYVSTVADRVYAFDISIPTAPRLVDSVVVDARIVNDVSTTPDGKIGVISREGASSRKNGIVFLDLAEPLHPKVLSEYTATVTSGVHSAFIAGHYVYLTDDGSRMMRVIDFQDPRNPREVGKWQIENAYLFTDRQSGTTVGRYLHDIQVKDGLAYLAYFKDGAVILDVGNGIKGGSPENPQFVSRYTYATTDFYPPDMLAGTHTVFRFRNYLIVGDEVFPQFFDTNSRDRIKTLGRLHILDVSDIEHPVKVAEYHVPEAGSHNVWVENDVLYVGNFEAGIRAVDVSGELRGDLREQGREIGSVWAASPNGFRPNVPMSWGAMPHRGVVYGTDMNSGLWVARLRPKRTVP